MNVESNTCGTGDRVRTTVGGSGTSRGPTLRRFRRLASAALLFAACACGVAPEGSSVVVPVPPQEGPVVAEAGTLVVFIPGAFSPTAFYDGARAAFGGSVTQHVVALPGLDGRPTEPALDLGREGAALAGLVARSEARRVALVGHSMGAAIALETAARVPNGIAVDLVLINPMVADGGGVPTLLAGGRGLVGAALRSGTLSLTEMWASYWTDLYFGRDGAGSAARERVIRENANLIVFPDRALREAQAEAVQGWSVPEGATRRADRVGVFVGGADPVFAPRQTDRLLESLGPAQVVVYPGGGHLLPVSEARLWEDVVRFLGAGYRGA
jgi:pimeloyl-ACP methyl ester carboxylesterase